VRNQRRYLDRVQVFLRPREHFLESSRLLIYFDF
jgi:hypothetical protein